MYSDYVALSACAFSVLFVPFMVISQIRFAHVMQNEGYGNRRYFLWIKRNFLVSYLPLIGICAIVLLSEGVLNAYLYNTYFYDNELLIGYILAVLLICAAISVVFYRYIRCIKIECAGTPLVCSPRFTGVFLLSAVMVGVVMTLENIVPQVNRLVFFMPLLTPLFVPLANLIPGLGKAMQDA